MAPTRAMQNNNGNQLAQSEANGSVTGIDDGGDADYSVRLDDIQKTFDGGEIVACSDIHLDIESDELVVLLGPSGCGKTTTLRIISGLETPDSGDVIIDGEDVTDLKPKDRNLAYVFQTIALYPHMDVRHNMQFGLDMKTSLSDDEKRRRVDEAADVLGISNLLDRKPGDLSGGQQQRVSLGRAMVMEPAAFLLDEPFSALDANLRDTMRVEIKKLQRQLETAMVFVTHDQEEAMTLGDKIVIMNDGIIQQKGTPYDIYNEPANLFVARFIGSPSTNLFDGTMAELDGAYRFETESFSFEIPEAAVPDQVSDGQSVSLGVRPDYLDLDPEDPLFTAELRVIESHGSDDAIYLDLDGKEVRAVVEQGGVDGSLEEIGVDFEFDRMWFFEQSGDRLT